MDSICYEFLKEYIQRTAPKNKKILEIGSFLVGGQEQLNLRSLFDCSNTFTGMDMRNGPGVDIVANSHDIPIEDGEADIIINYNTLEHDDDPFKSMQEMHRCLANDGVLLTSTPCYFYIHDYPSDYFRYTPSGIKLLGKSFKYNKVVAFGHMYFPQLIFGIFSDYPIEIDMNSFIEKYAKALKPYIYMTLRGFLRYLMVDFTKKVHLIKETE